jgi:integrase
LFYRSFYRLPGPPKVTNQGEPNMHGHVARKRDRYYAVIYEGLDPVTGKERRSWHPAGTDRAEAERLVARLAAERDGRNDEARSLTFGAYLTGHWLPAKRFTLATSTYRGYVHKTQRHILPAFGRKRLRRLRPEDLERLYDSMLHPTNGARALAPKTVYEVHLVIRGALGHAVRRGLVSRNVAIAATAPKLRSIPKVEQRAWTAKELQGFLRAAAGHRLFPAMWLSAVTGMRRNELLGLQWRDLDRTHARLSINRGLVAVGYELHQTRGKTRNARRSIDLDATTLVVLDGWRALQAAEYQATGIEDPGWMFTRPDGQPVHPALAQPSLRTHRPPSRCPRDPPARPAPHRRQPAHRPRHPRQGRVRTTRPRQVDLHHRDLPARPPRHASRRRPHNGEPHHRTRTHHPATPESRLNTRENTPRTR